MSERRNSPHLLFSSMVALIFDAVSVRPAVPPIVPATLFFTAACFWVGFENVIYQLHKA
jgi:hypothetical protein